MLSNPFLCRAIAWAFLSVGGYLAVFNTIISAVVIGELSGLGLWSGVAIAISITGIELWFAGWAREISHWQPLLKKFRVSPEKTALKLFAAGLGLLLVYHFDIESTRTAMQGRASDAYFFLWGLAWLIIGPEISIGLHGWLMAKAKQAEAKHWKENNSRDADRVFLRSERNTMSDLAEEAGKQSAIKKVSDRFGPQSQ